jgi:maleylpyruvate isomerase
MTAARDLPASLRWTGQGTTLFLDTLAGLPDDDLAGPSALPGWTRRHLVAHVAANAEALGRLVHWAATGEETPMYSSPAQRAADIEAGAELPAARLRDWAQESAQQLAASVDRLTDAEWSRTVRTAQGRQVPPTEIPWLRAREVMVHAVDLGGSPAFSDLPQDFLVALVEDVVARRSGAVNQPALALVATDVEQAWSVAGHGSPAEVRGPLDALAAYLAGRATGDGLRATADLPELPPWL